MFGLHHINRIKKCIKSFWASFGLNIPTTFRLWQNVLVLWPILKSRVVNRVCTLAKMPGAQRACSRALKAVLFFFFLRYHAKCILELELTSPSNMHDVLFDSFITQFLLIVVVSSHSQRAASSPCFF